MTPYTAICGHSRWCRLQAHALPISFVLSPTGHFLDAYTACDPAEDSLINSQRELDESVCRNELDIIQQARDEECSSCSKRFNISGT
jgi:hypothetical protein